MDEGWPWSYSAEQAIALDAMGLSVAITVKNHSNEAMPLSLGWHPYHCISAHPSAGDLEFLAATRREIDERGCAEDLDREPSFGMHRGETAAFTQWTGRMRLRTAAGDVISVESRGASHLVLHRPAAGDYLCAEPVTVLPGHLGGMGAGGYGVLQPGEKQVLHWTCNLERARTAALDVSESA